MGIGLFVSDLPRSSVIRSMGSGHLSLVSGVVGRKRGGTPLPNFFRGDPVLGPTTCMNV